MGSAGGRVASGTFKLISSSGVVLGSSDTATGASCEGCEGCGGCGGSTAFAGSEIIGLVDIFCGIRGVDCSLCSEPIRGRSGKIEVGIASRLVSLVRAGRERLDSLLWFRCRPILPSFSMATKLVLTFDSGLGDSVSLVPM